MIGDHIQMGGNRPFGAGLLVGGVEDEPTLVEIDPSGATPIVAGERHRTTDRRSLGFFEEQYEPGLPKGDALALTIDGLADVFEAPIADTLEALIVRAGRFEAVEPAVLEAHLTHER